MSFKVINKMYGGEVEVIFEGSKHQYFFNGKQIDSVTKILGIINKPYLIPWAAKVTTEKMAELIKPGVAYDEIQLLDMLAQAKRASYAIKVSAGDIGTLVHSHLEQIIKGENPGELVHEEAKNAVNRFIDWVNKNEVKFLLSEQMVFSKKYNYCGTLDFACRIGGKLILGDIKTSNQISYTEYGAQLSGYKIAREEEYGERFDGAVLVRVGKKDAEFEKWELDTKELKKYEKVFLNALSLYKSIDSLEKK